VLRVRTLYTEQGNVYEELERVMPVIVYTRHTKQCPHMEKGGDFRRCRCPKWMYGDIPGKGSRARVSAKTRSWEQAERRARSIDDGDELSKVRNEETRVTVAAAVEAYLQSAKDSGVSEDTLAKKTRTFKQLASEAPNAKVHTKGRYSPSLLYWCEEHGYKYLEQLTTRELTVWRSTWRMKSLAKFKRQAMVCGFFFFCGRQGWIEQNPMLGVGAVKVTESPTDYFTREEFEAIIDATYLYQGTRHGGNDQFGERLRALIRLMRWSGLAIRDAVTLQRSRLSTDDSLFLYRAKTGHPVRVLLPPDVAQALRQVPPGNVPNPAYFFWSGTGKPKTAVADWQRSFRKLFELAAPKLPKDPSTGKPKRCHPHMLRDTFAVEMLLSGADIREVSILLGHKSVKTTEKSYAPWVKALQGKLDATVRNAWLKAS
jgi:integrase/recombinase XerD